MPAMCLCLCYLFILFFVTFRSFEECRVSCCPVCLIFSIVCLDCHRLRLCRVFPAYPYCWRVFVHEDGRRRCLNVLFIRCINFNWRVSIMMNYFKPSQHSSRDDTMGLSSLRLALLICLSLASLGSGGKSFLSINSKCVPSSLLSFRLLFGWISIFIILNHDRWLLHALNVQLLVIGHYRQTVHFIGEWSEIN